MQRNVAKEMITDEASDILQTYNIKENFVRLKLQYFNLPFTEKHIALRELRAFRKFTLPKS